MNTTTLASSLRLAISGLYKGLRKTISSMAGCSMTEIETVGHIARHQRIQPTELATLTRVTPQSMSQILTSMEKAGIIRKTPDKEDKRKVYISLSPAGQDLLEQTRYERDAWLKKMIDETLTKEETDILARAIPILNKLANNK
jgi:DNA-binding MarR family transcriptional regulator